MIKISRPLKELSSKARYTREKMTKEKGREPTVDELSKELKVSKEDLILSLDAGREVESIYKTINENDGKPMYLIDTLQNQKEDKMIDYIALKEMIGKLESKDRQIIFMRYFEDKTQGEVAKKLSISQVQVSRIEKRIIESLRAKLSE